jgi:hypothetical protein
VGKQSKKQINKDVEGLIVNLQKYSTTLRLLVQGLGAGNEPMIGSYLQVLVESDLGAMLARANIMQIHRVYHLKPLQEILQKIYWESLSARKYLKGDPTQPTSMKEMMDRAIYAASQTGDIPPTMHILIPNIIQVTKASLDHIDKTLCGSKELAQSALAGGSISIIFAVLIICLYFTYGRTLEIGMIIFIALLSLMGMLVFVFGIKTIIALRK